MAVNGVLLVVDKVRIFKFDSNFSPIWMLNFDNYNIAKNGIALHSSGSDLAYVLKSSLHCPLGKIDTTSNSVIEEITLGSGVNCNSLSFSNDYSNIYVTGRVLTTRYVFKVGYANFGTTTVTSIPVSLNSVYSVHSYISSSQEFLMITGSVTSPTQSYSLLSVRYDTDTQQWAKKMGCPAA